MKAILAIGVLAAATALSACSKKEEPMQPVIVVEPTAPIVVQSPAPIVTPAPDTTVVTPPMTVPEGDEKK